MKFLNCILDYFFWRFMDDPHYFYLSIYYVDMSDVFTQPPLLVSLPSYYSECYLSYISNI